MSELKFIETTDETIYTDILEELENGVGEPLYPGDERRIFGDTMAKVIVTVYNTVNDACRQKMLRYARGTVLDALGEIRRARESEARRHTRPYSLPLLWLRIRHSGKLPECPAGDWRRLGRRVRLRFSGFW